MRPIVFRDRVKVYVKAGNGGDGCSAFRREKHVPYGGPFGGDGAPGGEVILRANVQLDSLVDLYYNPHQRAQRGGHGLGKQMHGRRGESKTVQVPCGTIVKDWNDEELILGELLNDGDELVVAHGGKGGLGNCHFVTPTCQAPSKRTLGTEGEEKELRLELKLMADVGLVGYPNAGKSTLITEISGAHPKIGAYPFTTLHPIIGTVIYEDFRKLRIADIPGLIEGAHEGIGLGYDFLRHIERTRFLLFIIDMAGTDQRDPIDDFNSLKEELKLFNPDLEHRPYAVVANKMDEPAFDENLQQFIEATGENPITIAGGLGEGIDKVLEMLYNRFYDGSVPGIV